MTTPRLILILILALSIFSPISFSRSGANAQDIDSRSDATLTANPVYQKQCAKCHGKAAEGRHFGGPSLVSPKIVAAATDDLVMAAAAVAFMAILRLRETYRTPFLGATSVPAVA